MELGEWIGGYKLLKIITRASDNRGSTVTVSTNLHYA